MSYLQNLRAAQTEINKVKAEEQKNRAEAEAQQRETEGKNLTEILNFLGFELKEPLLQNEYKVDGFTLRYSSYNDGYGDVKVGYRKNIKDELTFRLVVVKDTPYDELVEDFRWDCSDEIGGRDLDVNNVNSQTRWRAELADLLDRLNKQYYSRLPQYQRVLEKAQQQQNKPDFPHTYLFVHDTSDKDDETLAEWIDRGYRVIAMNTLIYHEGTYSHILLSKHPKIVPVTHTTHFRDEI